MLLRTAAAGSSPSGRTKGTEPMSNPEVQGMFLGYYEKRLKLQLLRAEPVQLVACQRRVLDAACRTAPGALGWR